MSEPPKLEGAIMQVLKSDDVHDLVSEYTELGVDSFLESGVTRDIPIVNTLLGVARVGLTVRDRLFARKLLEFLKPFDKVSSEMRRQMVEKLEADESYGRKVGEHLIELLDRIEAHRKPVMLACVFRAYNAEEIDATMLHRLSHAIAQLPAFEIASVRKFQESPPPRKADITTLQYLSAAGLLSASTAFSGMAYQLTPVGLDYLRLNLDLQD